MQKNIIRELPRELAILVCHIAETHRQLYTLGDGVVCALERKNPHEHFKCTIAFDPEKWTLNSREIKPFNKKRYQLDNDEIQEWHCSFTVEVAVVDGEKGRLADMRSALGVAKLVLCPRQEGLKLVEHNNISLSSFLKPFKFDDEPETSETQPHIP